MAITYEPISTQTLSTAAASVTFSSIPGTYTDLIVVSNGSNSTLSEIRIRFNSDSGSNYSETLLLGSGTNAISGRGTNTTYLVHNYVDTTRGMAISQINNYSSSNVYKTMLTRWNAPSSSDPYVAAYVGLWRNTAAITSVTILTATGNLASGSTFTLYGIKAA
jgi:hypothetical protein